MPAISMFYGIIVYMYAFDNKRHQRPHVHAIYAGAEAVVAIPDGELLEGNLPAHRMKLLLAWLEIHREDLMADWVLAVEGQRVFPIDPLK
jgi:hypothetical protein